MKGIHNIRIQNSQLSYKIKLSRNITVLRGDSATGKTTLIEMVQAYQSLGMESGVTIESDKPCVVLTSLNWKLNLSVIKDSIVFIDEGSEFILSKDFARCIRESNNYYVIATRSTLFNLPYSINEIYGIKNRSGNRYQGTKRLYSEFYPLYNEEPVSISRPDAAIVEDSNSGYEFFESVLKKYEIPCMPAGGKSRIYDMIVNSSYSTLLVIADGAAFGAEMERVLSLRRRKNLIIYLPESFEWLILRSDILKDTEVREILKNPSDHIESREYFSWENFFTALLVKKSAEGYLKYSKAHLNPVYIQKHETEAILKVVPDFDF